MSERSIPYLYTMGQISVSKLGVHLSLTTKVLEEMELRNQTNAFLCYVFHNRIFLYKNKYSSENTSVASLTDSGTLFLPASCVEKFSITESIKCVYYYDTDYECLIVRPENQH